MPQTQPPAITEENVQESRRLADDVTNIMHAIPEARNTGGMTEEIVEALNLAGDRLGTVDWESSTDEQIRVMASWCDLLPLLGLVPDQHDPNTTDWHWSAVRCFLAGAGYGAHAALAAQLCLVYPQCALRPEETFDEWMAAMKEAHCNCGLPTCLAIIPWRIFRRLPEVSRDDQMDLNWAKGVALLHILKHTRVYQDEVRVMFEGVAAFFRRDQSTNALTAQPRLLAGLLPALRMERADGRSKDNSLADVATSRCLPGVTFARLLSAHPLTRAPGSIIVGPFTALTPDPSADGWFQHGLRLERAWVAHQGKTRPFTGTDDVILGYAWSLEPATDDQQAAYNALAAAVPATYEVDSPFAILTAYQPNFSLEWCTSIDAYASLIDSVLIMSVMRDRVLPARREFPIVWVLPDDPTPEGSTNQGKTTAVGAMAGCMTPGILVTRPPDTNSAPDLRVVAGMIRNTGSLALDEWSMPKNQAHPLSARNLQTLATGGAVPLGEVLANNPTPVMLRQPIVASAKCLQLPEDVRNRSLFLFQRTLSAEERKQVNRHEAMVSGEVALRMRLAALSLVDQYQLHELVPAASEHMRFKCHVALAARLYELRTGKPGPEALVAITQAARQMEARYHAHFNAADESGLMSEMESGENLVLRATTLFGTMTTAEAVKLFDVLRDNDKGRVTAGQLLSARARIEDNIHSVRGLLANLMGVMPKANDRALAQAFARDLRRHLGSINDHWMLPDLLGIEGWRLTRATDGAGGTMRVRFNCANPGSLHFVAAEA